MQTQPKAEKVSSSKQLCVRFSAHADQRLHQRGLRPGDLELILTHGEWLDDGCVLSEQAIRAARSLLSQQGNREALQRLDHLRNVAVILSGDTVVTLFRADSKRIRRLRAGRVRTESSQSASARH